MAPSNQTNRRSKYTQEFKAEAVRLVQSGQSLSATAKTLGIPTQTLHGWLSQHQQLQSPTAGSKPISTEQMELARLRAECAKLKMERDILKKATAYFARESI